MFSQIQKEIKHIDASDKNLRWFGGILAVISAYTAFRFAPGENKILYYEISALFGCTVLLFPFILRRVYIVWMVVAVVIGLIISTLLFSVFFVLIVSPLGYIMRRTGRDVLSLGFDRSATSYWKKKDSEAVSKESFEKQY